MITVEDLRAARTLKMQVERCEESLLRLRSTAENVTTHMQEAGGGSGGGYATSRIENYVERLDAMQRKRAEALLEYEERLAEIDAWIGTLPEIEARVITARYIDDFRGWRALARRLNYSEDGVFKVHRRALSRLQDRQERAVPI